MFNYLNKNKVVVLFFLASFFIPLAFYTITLAPTVTFGDSGELIAAAYFLGISHPPGSPLWTLLAKIFTFLPLNSIAWRVNFSSAFFSALSSSIFFAVLLGTTNLLQLKTGKLLLYFTLLITTLLLAFSRTTWWMSVIAEVYSLNNLLFCFLLLTLYFWLKTKNRLFLYLSSFIFGLSLTNHYLFLILIAPLMIWLLYNTAGTAKKFKIIFLAGVFFLLGLSLYGYLPIRAKANPPINWGHIDSPQKLLDFMRRKQFGSGFRGEDVNIGLYLPISRFKSLPEVASRIFSSLYVFILSIFVELPLWVLLPSLLGMVLFFIDAWIRKKARPWFLLTILCFFSYGWGITFLLNLAPPGPKSIFTQYMFPFYILYIFLAVGAVSIIEKLSLRFGKLITFVCLSVYALFLFLQINSNYKISDWSKNYIAYNHAMNILNTADKNAVIIADKNNWVFPLLYLTKVEGKRPDIEIFDRMGNLFELVYSRQTIPIRTDDDLEKHRQIVEEEIAKKNPGRPFYYAVDKNFENYEHEINTEGILYKSNKIPAKQKDFASFYKNILSVPNIPWIESDSEYILSYYHLRFGDQLVKENKEKEALAEYQKAYNLGREHDVALDNLAATYVRLEKLDQGMALFKEVVSRNPRNTNALGNLAALYDIKGQTDLAIQIYKELLKINPKNLRGNMELAQLYEKTGDKSQALTHYLAVLSFLQDKKPILRKIAKLFLEVGECEKSEQAYKTLEKEIREPSTVNNIGVCYARKNLYSEARQYWEKAIKLDPSYQPAKDNLERLNAL